MLGIASYSQLWLTTQIVNNPNYQANKENLIRVFCFYVAPGYGLVPHSYGLKVYEGGVPSCVPFTETCTRCGYVYHGSQYHGLTFVMKELPNSEHDGYDVYMCCWCGYEPTGNPSTIYHNLGPEQDSAPSAANPCGGKERHFTNCDYVEYSRHNPGDWVPTDKPDPSGSPCPMQEQRCKTCDALIYNMVVHTPGERVTIEDEHTIRHVNYCTVCGEIAIGGYTIYK